MNHADVTEELERLEKQGRLEYLYVWETPSGLKRWTVAVVAPGGRRAKVILTLKTAEAFLCGTLVPADGAQ